MLYLSLLFLCISPIFAQETLAPQDSEALIPQNAPWLFIQHDSSENLLQNIARIMKLEYKPAGIHITDTLTSVLYVKSESVSDNIVALQPITSPKTLEKEITAFLQAGLIPIGMSFDKNTLAILLIEEQTDIQEWQIHLLPAEGTSTEEFLAFFEKHRSNGFLPHGIALHKDSNTFWILFLRNSQTGNILFNAHSIDALEDKLQQDIDNGAMPTGITIAGNTAFILYHY